MINTSDLLDKDIFALTGLENLSEAEKKAVFDKAQETIMYRVLLRLGDLLPDEDLAKLQTLLEAKDEKGTADFFSERGIDIDQIAAQEAMSYKSEMATAADALRNP